MDGPLVIERVAFLPTWTASLVGRMVYDITSSTYWIAGDTIDDGLNGWIQFGLSDDSILSEYIHWNTNLDDPTAISSINIPTLFRDSTSNVQVAINSITEDLDSLVDGTGLGESSIVGTHIGFTSIDVPFANSQGKFTVEIESVEDALNFLRYTTADGVLLKEPHDFGLGISSTAEDAQQALLDIDTYLNNLNADNVKALVPSTSVWSSVQSVLDMLNSNIQNISLSDLVGTPDDYGINKQFIKTNGIDTVYFSDIYASDIICQYPGTTSTTVQSALAIIQNAIDQLNGGTLSLDASDISFDDSPSIGFTNIDDVLDYLIQECFTASNLPEATQISSTGIGTSNNVQSSLEFLDARIESLAASIGDTSCGSPISPVSLSSDTSIAISNLGQEYLLLTHTYGGTSDASVIITARIVVKSASQDQDLIVSINDIDTVTVNKSLLYPGYTIYLMAKTTLSPNGSVNLTAQCTESGCDEIVIGSYRLLIEPSL